MKAELTVALWLICAPLGSAADGMADTMAGLDALNRHDFDSAVQLFTNALTDDTLTNNNRASVHYNRGIAYRAKGLDDQAIVDYTESLRLNSEYPNAYYNRGIAYRHKNLYEQAIADYTQALRLKPDFPAAHHNRGNAYYQKGVYDRAIADYTEALRMKPEYPEAQNDRGSAYAQNGLYDQAIADYTEALRLKPEFPQAHNNRGRVYDHKGLYDQSIADYTEALRLKPDYADAYGGRGRVYLYRGDFQKAADDFTRVLGLEPAYAYPALWRYMARTRSGVDGAKELSEIAARLPNRDWPQPLIAFYLGAVTRDVVLIATTDPDAKKQGDQQCEAWTYLAEADLLKGHRKSARRLFQQAANSCPMDFTEKQLAEVELKRLAAAH